MNDQWTRWSRVCKIAAAVVVAACDLNKRVKQLTKDVFLREKKISLKKRTQDNSCKKKLSITLWDAC